MQVHFGTELLRPEWSRSVICVGTFDGVHLGHRRVLSTAVTQAQAAELPSILVTFDRHPAAVLNPERCPKTIATLSENLREIEREGIAVAVVLPFNAWLSRMSAERFLREVLMGTLRAESLVVGHDFAMGNGREGTTAWLAARIQTTIVPPLLIANERVSSSRIRAAIEAGELEAARTLLGRPFSLSGVVVGGQHLGRSLGYPTLNLARSIDQALPADGIYAGYALTPRGRFATAISIGMRPTVNGTERTIEAYLLDYDGHSLYGASVDLHMIKRLREELRFDSLESLTEQIAWDVEETRLTLALTQT